MPENDKALFKSGDIAVAAGLLSRLPLGKFFPDMPRATADSAWAWPLIGALLGGLAGLVSLCAAWLGLPAPINAALSLATLIALTGALHEDGLADTCDGLWGGQSADRRLEIMKDSRVGTYGVLGLALSVLLRWSALGVLIQSGWIFTPLIAIGMLSRIPMVLLMASLKNVRSGGLAATTGRPEQKTALAATGIGLALAIALTGWASLIAAFWIGLGNIALAAVAKQKIGGQTGDILGASQQISEIAALAVFATLVA